MKKKSQIKVGIVGLGRSGWDLHAQALRKDPDYQITAVCDVDAQHLKQAQEELGARPYADYAAFLKHPELEVVVVAAKTLDHYPMAKQALLAGKHVVLEKPLTQSVAEVLELEKIAKKVKRILSPYYNFRFRKDFLIIRSVLGQGLLGKVYLIRRQVGYYNRRDDWQAKSQEAGGIISAATIHAVDQILQLAQQLPKTIWQDLQKLVSRGDVSDHSKLLMRFANGLVADIEVSWVQALAGCEWLVYGTRGAIRKYGDTLQVKWFDEKDVVKGQVQDRSYLSGEKITWQEKKYKVGDEFAPDYYPLLFKAIREEADPPVKLENAIRTMKVIEGLNK